MTKVKSNALSALRLLVFLPNWLVNVTGGPLHFLLSYDY